MNCSDVCKVMQRFSLSSAWGNCTAKVKEYQWSRYRLTKATNAILKNLIYFDKTIFRLDQKEIGAQIEIIDSYDVHVPPKFKTWHTWNTHSKGGTWVKWKNRWKIQFIGHAYSRLLLKNCHFRSSLTRIGRALNLWCGNKVDKRSVMASDFVIKVVWPWVVKIRTMELTLC